MRKGDNGLLTTRCLGTAVIHWLLLWASLIARSVKSLPAVQETWVRFLGSGRSPGGGNGNPLQGSCLEHCMNREAWQTTVRGVARVGHEPHMSHTRATHELATRACAGHRATGSTWFWLNFLSITRPTFSQTDQYFTTVETAMCRNFFRVARLRSVKEQALNTSLSVISNVALLQSSGNDRNLWTMLWKLSLIFPSTCAQEHNDTYSFLKCHIRRDRSENKNLRIINKFPSQPQNNRRNSIWNKIQLL